MRQRAMHGLPPLQPTGRWFLPHELLAKLKLGCYGGRVLVPMLPHPLLHLL